MPSSARRARRRSSISEADEPPKKRARSGDVATPLKARISREFQKRGGKETRGAATATARHFGWKSRNSGARVKHEKRRSVNHEKGDVYDVDCTMDAAYFREELRACGAAIRRRLKWVRRSTPIRFQIDSAGGHGIAVGHGNFKLLAEMMRNDFNITLVQQPGNSPMFNILDLNVWQGLQGKVDTLHKKKRHDTEELTRTVHDAWKEYAPQKILTAFEMLNDVAAETLETDGHCPQEGKGRGGARRAHGLPPINT
jgi:hypothetical protein